LGEFGRSEEKAPKGGSGEGESNDRQAWGGQIGDVKGGAKYNSFKKKGLQSSDHRANKKMSRRKTDPHAPSCKNQKEKRSLQSSESLREKSD